MPIATDPEHAVHPAVDGKPICDAESCGINARQSAQESVRSIGIVQGISQICKFYVTQTPENILAHRTPHYIT